MTTESPSHNKSIPKRGSLAHFYDEYILYKGEEVEQKRRHKSDVLHQIYSHYSYDYSDPYYVHDNMMTAIDDGSTRFSVYYEEEDPDIALWDTDLLNIFMKESGEGDKGKSPSLQSILESQISDEFRFVIEKRTIRDERDGTKYKGVEIFLCWHNSVNEEEEDDECVTDMQSQSPITKKQKKGR